MEEHEGTIIKGYSLPKGAFWKRKSTLLGALLLVVAIGLIYWYNARNGTVVASTSNAAVVDITSQGFDPRTISIKAGQSVEWVNEDTNPHQPATDPYPLENGLAGFRAAAPLQHGDSYSFLFNKPGTYTYHDHLNPFSFVGTVVVHKK